MAKPIIKFSVVPYAVGTYKGNRVQLEPQDGVYDLDFCREVVNEKRLSTSPDELLHITRMLTEVAGQKIAEDGRTRGITRLIKWQAFGNGTVESPTSPWDPKTCKAVIKPVLLADATKILDATFQNVSNGIGVKLNDVTWLGAQTVQNVLKVGADFSANGSHMEFLEGDSATLAVGETVVALANKSSDVSHAVFAYPAELTGVEPGTQALFVMKSRGGVAGGQVYTTKKQVTILAGDTPPEPSKKRVKVTFFNAAIPGGEGTTAELWIEGENLDGTTDYSHGEGDPEFFTAEASVNGGEFKRVEFEDRRAMLEGAPFGARVKLRLNIDPAKTEFDPTPIVVEDVVD